MSAHRAPSAEPTNRDLRRSADERQLLIKRAMSSNRTKLTLSMFDLIVNRWNGLGHQQRQERAAQCRTDGHDYVETPMDGVTVCRRCCSYRDAR